MSRLVVLDTETTGLEVQHGHRVIEIGCVELLGRRPSGRHFHVYLNPQRSIDAGAARVHGITEESLKDKPLFADVAHDFLAFVRDTELVIHNAPFDLGFLDAELTRWDKGPSSIREIAGVIDTLPLARETWPGQRNSLNALCRRLGVDNTGRQLHGALLDAQLLAEVYLAMTSGQSSMEFGASPEQVVRTLPMNRAGGARRAILQLANADEKAAHDVWLDELDRACADGSVWRRDAGA